jgi:uncharacterized protein
MNRNLLIFGVVLLVLVVVAFFMLSGGFQFGNKTADIQGHTIKLEIADNDQEREKGLSERDKLTEDTGMLFLFDKAESSYAFWMKGMRFPIDIIFLHDDKVVTIHHNVPSSLTVGGSKTENLTLYQPTAPANRVLELNAGQAKSFGLKEGDTVKINL